MFRPGPWTSIVGITTAFAVAVATRGGHLRVFWPAIAIIIAVVFAIHLARIIVTEEIQEYQPATDLLAAAFLGWAAISIPFSIDREQSLFEVLKLASYVMVYFLAASLPEDRHRRTLLAAFVAVILAEAAYGLIGHWTGKPPLHLWWVAPRQIGRATGTFMNANHFACLMSMGAFLAMGLTLAVGNVFEDPTERWAKRAIMSLLAAVMIVAMVLGLSRGAWAAFAAAMFIFVFLLIPGVKRAGTIGALMIIIVGAAVGTYFLKVDQKPIAKSIERVEDLSRHDELTGRERLSVWKSALAMIEDNPWTGTGWGTFRSAYPAYRRGGAYVGFVFAHNDYLQIAAGMGVPGLIIFLAFAAAVFRAGIRTISKPDDDFITRAMPGILAAFFAVLVHESVDFNLMNPSHSILFFALSGIVAAKGRAPK